MGALTPVSVGIDIGQIHDPSAICVAELVQTDHDGRMQTEYMIRHLKRLPLGMDYPAQALYLADMLCNPLFARRRVRVTLDRTGVGLPVAQSLMQEIARRPEARHIKVKPIFMTAGRDFNEKTGVVGKAHLVSNLQAHFQHGRIHAFPHSTEAKALREELRVYQIKVDQEGRDTYGAMKVGTHDDLVTAMALATLAWSGLSAEDHIARSRQYAELLQGRTLAPEWKRGVLDETTRRTPLL